MGGLPKWGWGQVEELDGSEVRLAGEREGDVGLEEPGGWWSGEDVGRSSDRCEVSFQGHWSCLLHKAVHCLEHSSCWLHPPQAWLQVLALCSIRDPSKRSSKEDLGLWGSDKQRTGSIFSME